jgi:hypothetical protein
MIKIKKYFNFFISSRVQITKDFYIKKIEMLFYFNHKSRIKIKLLKENVENHEQEAMLQFLC